MPQFATITLPTTDTDLDNEMLFKPTRMQNGVAFYVDRTLNGVDHGGVTPVLSISSVPASKNSKSQKVRVKLALPQPVLNSIGSITNAKEFESFAEASFTVPDRATQSHRRDLLNIFTAVLKQQMLMESLVIDGESVFSA